MQHHGATGSTFIPFTSEEKKMRKFTKSDEAIRKLSPEQYRVTQQNGTERPGTGEYLDNKERYCINSAALRFIHRDDMEVEGYGAFLSQVRIPKAEERAVLAGGCFWGVQDLVRSYDGVLSTRVGYTGGTSSHATYRNHDGHAEAVEIIFDPARISYRQILEFFFQIHDPSTRNRQGNDVGTSYRSAIFYTSDEQRRIAEDTIADVDASGLWPGKVVTEVVPAGEFWEAEPEHQDYLQRYPDGYTCHFVRPNWRLPNRTNKVAKEA
jgi:peptide-methionine (S)-S-oxide reductase